MSKEVDETYEAYMADAGADNLAKLGDLYEDCRDIMTMWYQGEFSKDDAITKIIGKVREALNG